MAQTSTVTPIRKALANAISPTLLAASELQEAFDWFNSSLFGGKLPPMMITFDAKRKKALGTFAPKRFGAADERIDWIVLNPEHIHGRDFKDVLSTLVHEMVHAKVEFDGKGKVKPYHCKVWCQDMLAIGLEPIIVNAKGQSVDKPTGRNATHRIIPRGRFSEAADKLIGRGFKLTWQLLPVEVKEGKPKKEPKPKVIKVEYCCPACNITRVWAPEGTEANCRPCDTELIVAEKPQKAPKEPKQKKVGAKAKTKSEPALDDPTKEFEHWIDHVDADIMNECGMGYQDLDDWSWMSAFEDGLKPRQAVDAFFEEVGIKRRELA